MRQKNTLEYLGLWERLHNPNFKGVEFDPLLAEAGSNAFTMSPSKWVELTAAIGILTKNGAGGGTYAQRDIAFKFAANQDKLSKSFESIGYSLTKEDKEAIKKRNFILHGHLSNIKKELVEQRWDMLAVALRLHKLCCILLLKAAGYSGEILNNEVIWGVKEACERKESPYINI